MEDVAKRERIGRRVGRLILADLAVVAFVLIIFNCFFGLVVGVGLEGVISGRNLGVIEKFGREYENGEVLLFCEEECFYARLRAQDGDEIFANFGMISVNGRIFEGDEELAQKVGENEVLIGVEEEGEEELRSVKRETIRGRLKILIKVDDFGESL